MGPETKGGSLFLLVQGLCTEVSRGRKPGVVEETEELPQRVNTKCQARKGLGRKSRNKNHSGGEGESTGGTLGVKMTPMQS